jgi:hypothetical protein
MFTSKREKKRRKLLDQSIKTLFKTMKIQQSHQWRLIELLEFLRTIHAPEGTVIYDEQRDQIIKGGSVYDLFKAYLRKKYDDDYDSDDEATAKWIKDYGSTAKLTGQTPEEYRETVRKEDKAYIEWVKDDVTGQQFSAIAASRAVDTMFELIDSVKHKAGSGGDDVAYPDRDPGNLEAQDAGM